MGYNLGLKCVRGAYIREEREIAEKAGKESPCHETLQDTHDSYNSILAMVIKHTATQPKSLVLAAGHNKDSIALIKKQIKEHGFTDNRIVFGQLKGFSD